MLISVARAPLSWRNTFAALTSRTALIGIASGAVFGVSAVAYRSASLSLDGPGPIMNAAVTLACVTVFQALVMLGWMFLRGQRAEIARMARAWRVAGLVGLSGMLASLGWFTAFALQNAAYVRALGQVEMLFTLGVSRRVFREALSRRELAGIALVVASLVLLILSL